MRIILILISIFSLQSSAQVPNYKCNGDMSISWVIKPEGANCIEIPIENGKHKDLTDYKIDKGGFVIDQQKRSERLAAEAAKEAEKAAKEAEKVAMKDIAKKSNLSKSEQDQLLKYLIEKLSEE